MELDALAQAFCEDCKIRITRIMEIVRCGAPLNRLQLDQLHQEYDTLYGGARAVHLPELEHSFQGMARYARYLRNRQLVGLEIEPQDWQKLFTNIELWFNCSEQMPDCFTHDDLLQSLQDMENRVNNGDEK